MRSKRLQLFLGWIITPFYVTFFFGILLVFHVLQVIAALFSARLQKHVLDLMNLSIIWNIRLTTGASFAVSGSPALPPDRPIILVSNHQSMYDIPMLMWLCRSRNVGFIAKKELGRWIPSISFALRRLGSVLIDRKDAKKAIASIAEFGAQKAAENQVASIFPEGTRARDGVMKRFKPGGLAALLHSMPGALVQPVAIEGNWQLLAHHFLPVPFGTATRITFLEPIEPSAFPISSLPGEIEGRIRAALGQPAIEVQCEDVR